MKLNFKHNVELKAETGNNENSEKKKTSFLTLAIILTFAATVTISLAIAIYLRLDVRLAIDYLLTNRP